MQTEIEFVDMNRSEALETQVKEGLDKIEARYPWVTHAIAYLKPGQAAHTTAIFELELRMSGPPLFVKEEKDKFQFAIHRGFDVITRQLEKRKDKTYHGGHIHS